MWRLKYIHPGDIDILYNKKNLSLDDTRRGSTKLQEGICACGEEEGALYYAAEHHRSKRETAPIIIEFEAPDVTVRYRCRDFLYTVFQLGEPEAARPVLEKSFGKQVLRYAERAWSSRSQSVALCDLACYDPLVIKAHYENSVVLGGRHNTVFRNAFIAALPIDPQSILRVWSPASSREIPYPEVYFNALLQKQR